MPKTLVLTEPGSLNLSPYDETPLKPGEVRAQAVASGISHGTELNLYRGTAPFHSKQFDPDLRLFVEAPNYRPYIFRSGPVTGLSEDLTAYVKLYPNPVRDMLQIEYGLDGGRVGVHDLQGRLLKEQNMYMGSNRIDLSGFPDMLGLGKFKVIKLFGGRIQVKKLHGLKRTVLNKLEASLR